MYTGFFWFTIAVIAYGFKFKVQLASVDPPMASKSFRDRVRDYASKSSSPEPMK